MTVVLTGRGLTLDEVVRVARHGEPVAIGGDALEHMRMCRDVVERVLAADSAIYGLTTGVGAQKSARVAAGRTGHFNRAMLAQCLVGQGEPVSDDVVRATMLRLANGFARGVTGVRAELCELVVSALNDGCHPPIRTIGSIGQADLAPLADLAVGLLDGSDLALAAGEGLAMMDNNAFSTGMAALAMHDCRILLDTLDVAGALDLEAFGASLDILHPIAEDRSFPGLLVTLGRLRQLLSGSPLLAPGTARNLQDPLTFRCLPQVHGAARDVFDFASRQLAIELNAAQGNPLVSLADDRVVSGGSFDPLPLAAALDFVRIGLAPVLTSAAERIEKLLHPAFSALRAGLAHTDEGTAGGYVEFGIAAMALVAEARLLAQPVSFEVVSSSQAQGIEDRITMAPLSARRLAEVVTLANRLIAVSLLVSTRAIELREPAAIADASARTLALVRANVSRPSESESIPASIDELVKLVASGGFTGVSGTAL